MKKMTNILKPNLLIVFGAIMLLYFLNWLGHGNTNDVIVGGYALVASSYFLAIGILGVVAGDKFNSVIRNIFDVAAVATFGTFMFIYFLTRTIIWADAMGPTAWIIKILSMIASLALVGLYIPAKFAKQKILVRFAYLFSAVFGLALLLDILFLSTGEGNVVGNIEIILCVVYVLFMFYLFNSFAKEDNEVKEIEEQK